jgi:hypothetical protein
MAEFGTQATQLSAPQGAGSAPLAPVQTQAVNTSSMQMLASAAPAIAQGITNIFKAQAQEAEQKYVNAYTGEINTLNAALADGSVSSQEAMARSRAITAKYLSNSQYGEAIDKARKNLFGGTDIGVAEDAVKTDADIRKSAKLAAQADGVEFYQGMSKQTEDALLRAHASGVRMQKSFEQQVKMNAEARAQGTWDREMRDAQLRDQSLIMLNDLAGTNLEASRAIALDLKAQVASGKKTIDQAQLDMAMHFTRINAGLTAAAGKNPELAGSYTKLFGDLQKASEALLDPKADASKLQGQIDTIVKMQSLSALQRDPVLQRSVSAAELFKGSPMALQTALGTNANVTTAVSQMISGNANVNPVVGNQQVESGVYKTLQAGMKDATNNQGNTQFNLELNRGINSVLQQVGDKAGKADAKTLEESARFLASPEYGQWVKGNQVDPQIQLNASKVFKTSYEQVVVKGIEQQLAAAFTQEQALPAAGVLKRSMGGESVTVDAIKRENLVINFNGAGITFDMKNVPNDPVSQRNAKAAIDSLNKAQSATNQLIRLGAHLEGTTDYAKYWEANKHVYFPTVYSAYKNLEIGQVVDGMRYKGGDAKAQSSWEAAK